MKINDIADGICKPIPGFEGQYLIYNDGRVFSISKNMFRKPVLYNNGYLCLMLKHRGSKKHFSIHRLVASAFVSNPKNHKTVNHIDGNKLNNHFTNLEWMTLQDNIRHGYANGLLRPVGFKSGYEHPGSKLKMGDVSEIISLRAKGLSYRAIGDIYGVHLGVIHNVIKGKSYAGKS